MCENAARIFIGRHAKGHLTPTLSPASGGEGEEGVGLPERPLPDMEANDRTLAQAGGADPMYCALMDHAFNVFENNTAASMEISATPDVRLAYSNRAAGVLEFVDQVESTRERLKAELLRRQKQAEKKK